MRYDYCNGIILQCMRYIELLPNPNTKYMYSDESTCGLECPAVRSIFPHPCIRTVLAMIT